MSSSSNGQITLVVGASRGLGLELVKQLALKSADDTVIGTLRKEGSADFNFNFPHQNTNNTKTLILDQSSPSSIQHAASQVDQLDTLIVNAAIGEDETILSTTAERMTQYFQTNVLGPLLAVQAFLPALRARKTRKIVFMSSESGSLAHQINWVNGFGGPYAVSKAACNMIAVQLHNELNFSDRVLVDDPDKRFTVVPLHPGWVATDMGGSGGMPVSKAAKAVINVIEGLKREDSAKFLNYEGKVLEW